MISTFNHKNSLSMQCRNPIKFKKMRFQAKVWENWPWNLNVFIWKYSISIKFGRVSYHCWQIAEDRKSSHRTVPSSHRIYIAWCQVYIRASVNFTMTQDSASELEDVASIISEEWNSWRLSSWLWCSQGNCTALTV